MIKNIKDLYLSNGIISILLLMIFSGYIESQLYNFYIIIYEEDWIVYDNPNLYIEIFFIRKNEYEFFFCPEEMNEFQHNQNIDK